MRVWVTRAQPGAERTARAVRDLGHVPLVAPLLRVAPLATLPVDLTDVGAFAFTSANAVAAFAELEHDRTLASSLTVFAVGEATAQAARRQGFDRILSADGDTADLARLIGAHRAAFAGDVLHPCALQPAGDLVGDLRSLGVSVVSLALYDTLAAEALPTPAAEALAQGDVDVVLVHSPKAAQTLRRLLTQRPGDPDVAVAGGPTHPAAETASLQSVRLFALSAACALPLATLPFQEIVTASVPREDAMLARLAT